MSTCDSRGPGPWGTAGLVGSNSPKRLSTTRLPPAIRGPLSTTRGGQGGLWSDVRIALPVLPASLPGGFGSSGGPGGRGGFRLSPVGSFAAAPAGGAAGPRPVGHIDPVGPVDPVGPIDPVGACGVDGRAPVTCSRYCRHDCR